MVALLANGKPPEHSIPLALFRDADVLIACDGAYKTACALGREPDFVVGDGDSLDASTQSRLATRFICVTEQETNDLNKAFRFAVSRYGNKEHFVILGATGLREDHTIGNIFHLLDFALVVPSVEMFTNAGRFNVILQQARFDSKKGDSVSLFAPTPNTRITSSGLAWPLCDDTIPFLWSGTLNRAITNTFFISVSAPILIYRPYTF